MQCLARPDGSSLLLVTSPATLGGFWSEDNGDTWHAVKAPTPYPVGTSLLGSQANPERWWLATTSLPGAHKSGVFRTDDKGGSWERLDIELPKNEYFQELSAHREGQVLVGLTASGDTFVSRDGGDTWQAEDLTGGRPAFKLAFLGDDLVFQPSQEGTLYAVRDASGEPQPPVELKFLEDGQFIHSWDADGRTIGAVVLGREGGLAVSRDAGDTWDAPRKDLYGGSVLVSASPTGDQILHQGSAITQLDSGDGEFRKVRRPGDLVAGFCPLPEGGWITADRVHGLYSTANWKRFGRVGVPAAPVTALAVSEGALLAGTETGLFRSPLPVAGPDWESPGGLFISGNHIVDMDVWAENPSLVWRTRRINLYCTAERSTDAGQTWLQTAAWPDAIFAVHIHPQDPDRVMHSFGYLNNGIETLGVRTTTDGGSSWQERDHGRFYLDFAADPSDPDGVWMASYTNGLYYSSDFGGSWEAKTTDEANTVLVTTDGTGASRVLIGGEAIRYSDDGGTSFHTARIDVDGSLRVVAFAQHDGVLFAATASIWYPGNPPVVTAGRGVLRSKDNGKTWHNASGDLPFHDVRALTVDPGGRYLYAGLQGGSVHRLAL
ncbi:WD40/YVTN/BNR-like repeat-containing protein [Streptomyces sp. NPDC055961]|uniref:WD40/YVTN/BNR-like repeat-containing protein n=1 Tax=Streptomyces sp. NPDC055961 TaxID=3345666 RepID=UPI0035DA2657